MGLITLPVVYSNGNVLDAADLTANAGTIVTLVNGNLDDANISNSADIGVGKIGDASADASAGQAVSDPFPADSQSLATTLAIEIQQLRFKVLEIDNSIGAANAFWYENSVAPLGATVGDIKAGIYSTPPAGWILMDDGSIGNVASNANRANADTEALFAVLWDEIVDVRPFSGNITSMAVLGTATAGGGGASLIDTGASFITDGVVAGMFIQRTDTNFVHEVLSVNSETNLTTTRLLPPDQVWDSRGYRIQVSQTSAPHGLSTGDSIYLTNINTTPQANNTRHTIHAVPSNTSFTIAGAAISAVTDGVGNWQQGYLIDSGGTPTAKGANAAADYAANKRMGLPRIKGRSLTGLDLIAAGTAPGVQASVLGRTEGRQTHRNRVTEMASHQHGMQTGRINFGFQTFTKFDVGSVAPDLSTLDGGSVPFDLLGPQLTVNFFIRL